MIECTLKQVRLLLELARAVALQPDISISDPGTSARSVHFTLLLMNADSICFYPRPFFGVYLCCRICEGCRGAAGAALHEQGYNMSFRHSDPTLDRRFYNFCSRKQIELCTTSLMRPLGLGH